MLKQNKQKNNSKQILNKWRNHSLKLKKQFKHQIRRATFIDYSIYYAKIYKILIIDLKKIFYTNKYMCKNFNTTILVSHFFLVKI